MMTSCPALKLAPVCWWVVHHFAVFSVAIPRSSASTCAATADGASPTTDPAPCEASHARRKAFIAVVFPAPAGPTNTSTTRPDTATDAKAAAWSGPSIHPSASGLLVMVSTIARSMLGPVVVRARCRRRSSAARRVSEENSVECLGRNTEVPSGRRNSTGLVTSSGGVRRRDACSAASATMAVMTSRSSTVANRHPIVWRAASAIRFQRRHVERFSPTTSTTDRPTCPIRSNGTSSARNSNCCSPAVTVRAHAVASVPSCWLARVRQCSVSSAKDRTCLSGRVASVAWARSFMMVAGDGRLPCWVT